MAEHHVSVLDPGAVSLEGVHLIEASAGTGKTYTITSLYLRLLLEKRLRPEQILVVTFTEAATKELKEKIRHRLAGALAAFKGEPLNRPDPFVEALALRYHADASAQRVINAAIWNMDLAAIYTIHGFCGRLLQEFFVDGDFSEKTELAGDSTSLLQQIVDDYWRCKSGEWDAVLTGYLHFKDCNADTLFTQLREAVQQLLLVGISSLVAVDDGVPVDRRHLVEELAGLWAGEREAITGLLKSGVLKVSHSDERIDARAGDIGRYFDGGGRAPFPVAAFEMFSAGVLAEATRKKSQVPNHRFFSVAEELLAALDREYRAIRREVVEQCVSLLPARKILDGHRSFDDLLFGVRDGLRSKETGEQFAGDVRGKYPVALIDEFQDTDTVQFEIFESIYRGQGSSLFLIGDPKQAIYRFRGADIFAYLKASATVDNVHTLDANYRSEPRLVEAVNSMFGLRPRPFVFPSIVFRPVHAAGVLPAALRLENDENHRPLVIWRFGEQENRTAAKWLIGRAVAEEIRRLLAAGLRSSARLGERNLAGGDIAVLVRTHSDGEIIHSCLQERQVQSVTYSQISVFLSREAWELQLLLAAVSLPWNEKRLKAALATSLFDHGATVLDELQREEWAWSSLVDRFVEYLRVWQEKGLVSMMRVLLHREGVSERLAGYVNGERRLTNLRHLLEIAQREVALNNLGPAETVTWLRRRRRDGKTTTEEEQLRLESDEHLVKIVTIHRSKGLEFPVVFCPFLWDSRLPRSASGPVFFHDGTSGLRVDLEPGPDSESAALQEAEDLAEELRLLYVALTRARNRCYLSWGKVMSGHRQVMATSGLGHLLKPEVEGAGGAVQSLQKQSKESDDEALQVALDCLVEKSKGTVSVAPLPIPGRQGFFDPVGWATPGEALVFGRRLTAGWAVHSFSALQHGIQATEEPDHDGLFPSLEPGTVPGKRTSDAMDLLAFPSGPRAGSCLHKIFEEMDFTAVDHHGLSSLIAGQLRRFGFDPVWSAPLAAGIKKMLLTPLDRQVEGLSLGRLTRSQRLNEMEFYYSLSPMETAGLRQAFERHITGGPATAPAVAAVTRRAEHGWPSVRGGFMKGFVDLVFEWQGRYYVADYKSNYLGDSPADYSQGNLDRAMVDGGYELQYHIYVLALHRYLKVRLQDEYDYDRHFGAVYYLFIRGMRPEEGPGSGVCRRRPVREMIESLDRCLGGDEGNV